MHPAVNWNEAPKDAVWWAMDQDGGAAWVCAPHVDNGYWFAEVFPVPDFGYTGQREFSLTQRPSDD